MTWQNVKDQNDTAGTISQATPNGNATWVYGGTNLIINSPVYRYPGDQNPPTGKAGFGQITVPDSHLAVGDTVYYTSMAPAFGLQYVDFGNWAMFNCSGTSASCLGATGSVVYGGFYGGPKPGASLISAVPTSGYASYWGKAIGSVTQPTASNSLGSAQFIGDFGMTATFATSKVAGVIENINAFQPVTGGAPNWKGTINDIQFSGSLSTTGASAGTYAGTTSATTNDTSGSAPTGYDIAGATGAIVGGLYGTNGTETAGTFYLTGGAKGTQLDGSFGAVAGTLAGSASAVLDIAQLQGSLGSTLTASLKGFNAATVLTYTDTTNAGFTDLATFTTPGGAITAVVGGSNNFQTDGRAFNDGSGNFLLTNVTKGDLTIASSTDPAITTKGGGSVEQFGDVVGLSYSDFGVWSISSFPSSDSGTPLYVGGIAGGSTPTASASMPTSGFALYNGKAVGYVVQNNAAGQFWGNAALIASFTSGGGNIDGQINGIKVYAPGGGDTPPNTEGTLNDLAFHIQGFSGTTYTGKIVAQTSNAGSTFDITGATGNVEGSFYGPVTSAPAETTGVFDLSGNGASVIGSFGAAKTTTAVTTFFFNNSAGIVGGTEPTFTYSPVQVGTQGLSYGPTPPFHVTDTFTTPNGIVTASFLTPTNVTTVSVAGKTTVSEINTPVSTSTDTHIPAAVGELTIDSFGPVVGLQYTNFGTWDLAPNSTDTAYYVSAFSAVQQSNLTTTMPTSGQGQYTNGVATGYIIDSSISGSVNAARFSGNAALTADFAIGGGAISGSITGITAYPVGGGTTSAVNDIALNFTSFTGNHYTGNASAASGASTYNISGATGTYNGNFFGNGAASATETSGTFALSSATAQVTGSFGAKGTITPAVSDRRLKQEIVPEGRLANGLALYSWRYLDGTHRFTGVMAQDLLADARFADAVEVDADGLMRVDYARLGFMPADFAEMVAEGERALALWRKRLH